MFRESTWSLHYSKTFKCLLTEIIYNTVHLELPLLVSVIFVPILV